MGGVKGNLSLRGYTKATDKAAREEASQAAADHILEVAQQLVPHEYGTLQDSGRATPSPAGYRASVTFGTPYGRRQHEELTWKHKPGRQAKYLEQPMLTEHEVCLAIMAAVLRRAAR